MKSILASAVLMLSFSLPAFSAPSTYDREFAFLRLLDMGFNVSVEDMGEMFRDNIFILSNSEVCAELGSYFWDESGHSCLLQVTPDGDIIGFQGDHSNSLYE